jgi:hypothetical protein
MGWIQRLHEATKEVSNFTPEDDAFYDALSASVSKAAYAAVKYRLQRRKDGGLAEHYPYYAISLDNNESVKIAKILKHAGSADKSGSDYICQGRFSFKRGIFKYVNLRNNGLTDQDLEESDQMKVFYDNLLSEMNKLGYFWGGVVVQL